MFPGKRVLGALAGTLLLWTTAGSGAEKPASEGPGAAEMTAAAKAWKASLSNPKAAAERVAAVTGLGKERFPLARDGVERVNFLVLGGDEKLALALAGRGEGVRVYLLGEEAAKIDSLRKKVEKAGLYGRVTCHPARFESLHLPSYFFDALIANGKLSPAGFREAYRLLKPGRLAFFAGPGEVTAWLAETDAPGGKQSRVGEAGGAAVLYKGFDPGNKYLKLPLVRLWSMREDVTDFDPAGLIGKRYLKRRIKPGQVAPAAFYRGKRGEIVSDRRAVPTRPAGAKRVPLEAYTGRIVRPEEDYEEPAPQKWVKSNKSEGTCHPASGPPPPYKYEWMSGRGKSEVPHHGWHVGKDLKTDKEVWTFADPFMYHGCCSPFLYVNDLLFKSTYGTLMALDPRSGKPLWTYRNGGNKCARPLAARSMLFMPTITGMMGASRMGHGTISFQAFVWEKLAGEAPPGDELETGPAKLLGAGIPARAGDWPTFGRDARRTGNSPEKGTKPPLKLLWKFATRGEVKGSLVVAGGTVYFGSLDHKFYALDAKTGAVKWVFYADAEIRSSPCVWGSGVYFGCDDGRVYALERSTGKLAWSYRTATSAPRSAYFTGAHDPRKAKKLIEKLKSGDKKLLEKYSPYRSTKPMTFNGQPLASPGVVRSAPAVVDGVLYVGTGLGSAAEACWGYLYALDAITGKLLWKVTDKDITDHRSELAIGVTGPPCVYKGRVHFSYGIHTAVDAKTGKLLLKGGTVPAGHKFRGWWDQLPPDYKRHDGKTMRYWVDPLSRASSGVRGGLAVAKDENLVLVVCRQVCRADKVEVTVGKKKRKVAPGPVRVFAVDATSGEVKWEGWGDREGIALFEQPPALHRGKVYVAGGKGIAIFDLARGSDKVIPTVLQNPIRPKPWAKRIVEPERRLAGAGGFLNTSPAIAGGHIYAGSDDGHVYAWKLDGEKPVWKHKTGGKVRSSPAIAQGRLYIGSDDGHVYCFGP